MGKLLICLLLALCMTGASAEDKPVYGAMRLLTVDEGHLAVRQGGSWGIVDHTGCVVVPCEWDSISGAWKGRAVVERNGLCGVVDLAGNVLLAPEWESVTIGIEGFYVVRQEEQYALLDAQGEVLLPFAPGTIGRLLDGSGLFFRGLEAEARTYYALEAGRMAEVPRPAASGEGYSAPGGYRAIAAAEGVYIIEDQQGKRYFTDKEGAFLSDVAWDEAHMFLDGLSRVVKDGRTGFVNEQGELVIPLIYDGAWNFSEGLALVRQGEERFWIDTTGRRIAEWNYAMGSRFCRGAAVVVTEDDRYGLIDRTGALIVPCEWDDMVYAGRPFSTGDLMQVERDGRIGLMNPRGELVTQELFDAEKAQVLIRGSWAYVLQDGTLTIWSAEGQVY